MPKFMRLTRAYDGKPVHVAQDKVTAVLPPFDRGEDESPVPDGWRPKHKVGAYVDCGGLSGESGIEVAESVIQVMTLLGDD